MLPNLSFYERVNNAVHALESGCSVSIREQDLIDENSNLEEIRFYVEEQLFGNHHRFHGSLPLLRIEAIGDTGGYRLEFVVVEMYD